MDKHSNGCTSFCSQLSALTSVLLCSTLVNRKLQVELLVQERHFKSVLRPTLIGTKMTIRKWSIFVCHFRNAESVNTTLIGTDLVLDGFLSVLLHVVCRAALLLISTLMLTLMLACLSIYL